MTFVPAPVGTGIVLKKMGGSVPAKVEYVVDTSRSTTIGIGNTRIHTVEHVMAALKAYRIDNLVIQISNIEPPIGNGGSDHFVTMIEEAGIEEQDEEIEIVCSRAALFPERCDHAGRASLQGTKDFLHVQLSGSDTDRGTIF